MVNKRQLEGPLDVLELHPVQMGLSYKQLAASSDTIKGGECHYWLWAGALKPILSKRVMKSLYASYLLHDVGERELQTPRSSSPSLFQLEYVVLFKGRGGQSVVLEILETATPRNLN